MYFRTRGYAMMATPPVVVNLGGQIIGRHFYTVSGEIEIMPGDRMSSSIGSA
jgi:hypothetical protein